MSKPRTYVTIITKNDVEFKTINRDVHDRYTLARVLDLAKALMPGDKIYFGSTCYDLSTESYTGYLVDIILKSYISLYRCSGIERRKVGVKDLKEHFKKV